MELNERFLIDSYIFFAKKLASDKYVVEVKSESIAKTFLNTLRSRYHLSTLGEEWLWRYLVFQFDYWQNLSLSSFDKRIKFSFIFGNKAFLRYEQRNQEFDWIHENCSIIYTISKKQFCSEFGSEKRVEIGSVEDVYKGMFLNKDEGLSNCLLLTTLFNPSSICCQQCCNQIECKELLRMNYPKIYKNRNIK